EMKSPILARPLDQTDIVDDLSVALTQHREEVLKAEQRGREARDNVTTGATLAKRERVTISRSLKVLIPLIQADLAAGDRAGMQYYADAGDKLIEAKESGQVAHGYWGAWVSKNFALANGTARRYMRLARLRADNIQNGIGNDVLPRSLSEMDGDT